MKKKDREQVRRILGRTKLAMLDRLADGDERGVVGELAAATELEERLDAADRFEELNELTKGKL